ncbi:hypothetical protein [Acinetobacter oleivorans]|uniref:hypothetical protein n=1 Tax=Acinetobacter oleivorans TaxID=1148157 RepID=UPI00125FCFBD|nr:hypothetical protein [Acinetobacter oleivorans]
MQFLDFSSYIKLIVVIKGRNFPVHYLRTEEQFIDAMYRYSYLAKVDDKEGIRHKGFGVIKIPTKSS